MVRYSSDGLKTGPKMSVLGENVRFSNGLCKTFKSSVFRRIWHVGVQFSDGYSNIYFFYLRYIKPTLTAADFNSVTHILVTGFSNGVFFIHEMPEAQLVNFIASFEAYAAPNQVG